MNQRTEYLLRVLEQIGTPLMASILQAPGRGVADETQKDAQRMAELLARTTQASIEMSRSMDFSAAPDQGDSLRVALAALAGGLVGAYFKNAGKAPGENDLKKIMAALQTVLTYSENFMPGADAAIRLDNLAALGQKTDIPQAELQYIHAFVPVVNAIVTFPFGQPEQKLIMEVADRLSTKAADIRKSVFGDNEDNKRIELSLLAALAKIYAGCHEAETARMMALTEAQRAVGGVGLDSVWKAFDLRTAMLETLAKSMVPGQFAESGGSSKAPTAPLPQKPATPSPVQQQAPAAPQAPPAPPPVFQQPAQQAPAAPPAGGANPMSMFSKKPADSAAAPPSQPPAQHPSQAHTESPANPPPAPPSGGSGPMSFFKAPPKKE